ncbi:MAG TPA: heme-binding protein [Dehalococcoidia bacterium]|nr:heme-binding protein [Dehalococcoidia bacterium]
MDKEDARRVMRAAEVKYNEMQKAVCIAIVDISGAMVLFERFGNVASYTAAIAEGKATGSAFTGRDSAMLEQMAAGASPVYDAIKNQLTGRRFVPRQGAVPLVKDGIVVGGIGVSGGTSEEDETIAKAGAAAL